MHDKPCDFKPILTALLEPLSRTPASDHHKLMDDTDDVVAEKLLDICPECARELHARLDYLAGYVNGTLLDLLMSELDDETTTPAAMTRRRP